MSAALGLLNSAHRFPGAPVGRFLQGMPSLKRAPSGSPAKAGPRGSIDSPAKATPPPAQRFRQSEGINGNGLDFNGLSASADSAAGPGQRSLPHPANASLPPAARLYPYRWRARDEKRVMQSYDGKCALRDSLDQNLEPLRAMYKELWASFGLTTTPPKGTKKKELVRELEELRHRALVEDARPAPSGRPNLELR